MGSSTDWTINIVETYLCDTLTPEGFLEELCDALNNDQKRQLYAYILRKDKREDMIPDTWK